MVFWTPVKITIQQNLTVLGVKHNFLEKRTEIILDGESHFDQNSHVHLDLGAPASFDQNL